CDRNGPARARLQSYAGHEHRRCPTAHGGDEGIVALVTPSSLMQNARDGLAAPSAPFSGGKSPRLAKMTKRVRPPKSRRVNPPSSGFHTTKPDSGHSVIHNAAKPTADKGNIGEFPGLFQRLHQKSLQRISAEAACGANVIDLPAIAFENQRPLFETDVPDLRLYFQSWPPVLRTQGQLENRSAAASDNRPRLVEETGIVARRILARSVGTDRSGCHGRSGRHGHGSLSVSIVAGRWTDL